ncbi:hypothetical protein FG386_002883 [Cryptosporidium ryanae]|uniref:uncharacterized protein n=1 Tax=Cryptosporidium ryanae TaxID=515981 RepID=UPI00351A26CA|nr:hypothetical protein FG386_002883 [Cryptosporidium ryanae]
MEEIKESLELLFNYSRETPDVYREISELSIEINKLGYRREKEDDAFLEGFIFDFLQHINKNKTKIQITYVKRLKLINASISTLDFFQLINNESEFSMLSDLELVDCRIRSHSDSYCSKGFSLLQNESIKRIKVIRTEPFISKYCSKLEKITYEPSLNSLKDETIQDIYDFLPSQDNTSYYDEDYYSDKSGHEGFHVESVELIVPRGVRDDHFIGNCFIGCFPHIENLKELKITGNGNKLTAKSRSFKDTRTDNKAGTRDGFNDDHFHPDKLERLILVNIYVSLETLEYFLYLYNFEKEYIQALNGAFSDLENQIDRYPAVLVDLGVDFESSSKCDKYSIKKYTNNLSIQEESNLMINSDLNKYGFGDFNYNSKNEDGCVGNIYEYNKGFGRGKGYGGIFGLGSKSRGHSNRNSAGTGANCCSDSDFQFEFASASRREAPLGVNKNDSRVDMLGFENQHIYDKNEAYVKPYIHVKKWEILVQTRNCKKMVEMERGRKEINANKYGIKIMDEQTECILLNDEEVSSIMCSLISKTLVCNVIDHSKTKLILSPYVINFSIGYDNLIYSGYLLNILHYYQESIVELSILTCLIPMGNLYFNKLKLNNIKVLKVSLFKNNDLTPTDLIDLCRWLNSYGKKLEEVHIRVTGITSDWVPCDDEITKLELTWKKISPIAGRNGKVKFECCFADHIFSKINKNGDLHEDESSD